MDARSRRKKKKKADGLQIIRLAVQIVFFIFLPALYINAFFELKIVWESLMDGSFNLTTLLPQMIELIAVIPVTILLGRFFCGWLCAFGAFGDFIYKIVKKAFRINVRINEKADRALKFVKFGILVFVVVFLWTLDIPGLSSASPWDVFGMIATVGSTPAIGYVLTNLTLGFIFFALIAVGSVFIQRFFCRYLCPLGAVFSILSALKLTRVKKPAAGCGKCRICTNACAMGIPLYKSDSVHSGECIECLQCVSACPRNNVTYSLAGSSVRPLVAGSMAAIAITGIYGSAGLAFAAPENTEPAVQIEESAAEAPSSPTPAASAAPDTAVVSESGNQWRGGRQDTLPSSAAADTQTPASDTTAPESDASSDNTASSSSADALYADGTYTGTGIGFRGATTQVSVTVSDGAITDITPLSYGDDAPYFDRAFASVCSDIMCFQCSDVDAVSGATYSSIGIMEAVQDALSQAAL
jgi:polyferredoxin/uncharacterized protein with FMN-binding domain